MPDVSEMFFQGAKLGATMFSDVRTSVDRIKAMEEETRRWELMREERAAAAQREQDTVVINDFIAQTNTLAWWKANGDSPEKIGQSLAFINAVRQRNGLAPIEGLTDIRKPMAAAEVSAAMQAAIVDPINGELTYKLMTMGLRDKYGDQFVDGLAADAYKQTIISERASREKLRAEAEARLPGQSIKTPLKTEDAQQTAQVANEFIKATGFIPSGVSLEGKLATSLMQSGIMKQRAAKPSDLPASLQAPLEELPENATAEDRLMYTLKVARGRMDRKTFENKLETANTSTMSIAQLRKLIHGADEAGVISAPKIEVPLLGGGSTSVIDEPEAMKQFMTPDRYEEYMQQKRNNNMAMAEKVFVALDGIWKMADSGVPVDSIKLSVAPMLGVINEYAKENGFAVMTEDQLLRGVEDAVARANRRKQREEVAAGLEISTSVANIDLIRSHAELNRAQARHLGRGGGGGGGGGWGGGGMYMAGDDDITLGALPSSVLNTARNPKTGALNPAKVNYIGRQYFTQIFGSADVSNSELTKLANMGMSKDTMSLLTFNSQSHTGLAMSELNAMVTTSSNKSLALWVANPQLQKALMSSDERTANAARAQVRSELSKGTLRLSRLGSANLDRNLAANVVRVTNSNGYSTDSNVYLWAQDKLTANAGKATNKPAPAGEDKKNDGTTTNKPAPAGKAKKPYTVTHKRPSQKIENHAGGGYSGGITSRGGRVYNAKGVQIK